LLKRPETKNPTTSDVTVEEFSGVHPAWSCWYDIHFLDPVVIKNSIGLINFTDVWSLFGKLFVTGELNVEACISHWRDLRLKTLDGSYSSGVQA